MRIDQFISHSSYLSRREVKLAIKKKQITINGMPCNSPATKVSNNDIVIFNGKTIDWPTEKYYMLHKPSGYCCSHNDDGHPSALKLLPNTSKKLHFAGRLDADTTGLVLISSDGAWCHRVTSPKQKTEKCKQKHYQVGLVEPLDKTDIQSLESGLLLRGEKQATLPAVITPIEETLFNIAITEGRYHQVKRMFAAVNNHVKSLHRFQIADISLDSDLAVGEYRALTNDEVNQF